MSRYVALLQRAFGEAEAILDWLKYRSRKRREPGRYHIQPYRGHGTGDNLFLSGRVFAGDPIPTANEHDASVRNLWHTLRRLGSDEVPLARVRAAIDGMSQVVLANEEGLFEVVLPVSTSTPSAEVWREIDIELVDPVPASGPVTSKGFCIVPPEEARFGIISDIDDTVVKTEVANLIRMMRLVLLTNAHTRLPFAGVAAFYRALHAGPAGPSTNPIFYVSSSPWNFYDLLMEVFYVHDIPPGPLFLKDYGLARDLLLSRGHAAHKLDAISHIFDSHPRLSFVLLGDSGQKDPEIYREIVARYPGRILAIYIRDVSPDARDAEVTRIAKEVAASGVDLVLVHDTVTAAEHAADRGLIDSAALSRIREERSDDLRAPGPFEGLAQGGG